MSDVVVRDVVVRDVVVSDIVLELAGLTKEFGSGENVLRILHGLDLTVRSGELVGIVGASGSGKTTLLNLLGCLDRPTSGRYVLAGRDVARLSDDELARARNRSIGFVFQSFQLIPQLDVLENVELPLFYDGAPKRTRRARCEELLASVGMMHRLHSYPTQLSGGECQRVAIARALVNQPALLLADEPTGNLDSKNGAEVMQLFRRLHAEGRTIVMVTHNPEIAAALPRVVEMQDGRIVRDVRSAGLQPGPGTAGLQPGSEPGSDSGSDLGGSGTARNPLQAAATLERGGPGARLEGPRVRS